MASAAGASAVLACDVDDARRSLARRFGATHMANPAEAMAVAKNLTAGRGADVALDLSGSPTAAAAWPVRVAVRG